MIYKESDKKFISYALRLAKKNLGNAAPNPTVACIITKDDQIISSGVTSIGGRPHAEVMAIQQISNKEKLIGSTVYITLEPCSHHGKTSPCVEELIKHKVAKVVIACIDPDQRVNGKGIKRLREASIEVICGVFEKEAQEINRGFFKAKKTGMPFITLKIASSLDGKIATKNFDSKWITSEKARTFSHNLRAKNDGILVGANTIRKDNSSLDCRIPGLENFSPQIFVISGSLKFLGDEKIFQNTKKIPTTILTHKGVEIPRNISDSDVKIIFCQKDSKKNDEINLEDAMRKICDNGINSLLIEGGQKITTQFLQQNLVDELVWIRNKKIIGDDGISAIGGFGLTKISDSINSFSRLKIHELEEDVIEIYTKILMDFG